MDKEKGMKMGDADKIIETDTDREIRLGMDAQRRAKNCLVDIQNVLKKWQCTIDPIVQISGQGISRSYAVIPLVERPVQ